LIAASTANTRRCSVMPGAITTGNEDDHLAEGRAHTFVSSWAAKRYPSRSHDAGVHPDLSVINNWAQHVGDFGVYLTFKLITGESARDAGDEVGNLYAWFSAGIDEPESVNGGRDGLRRTQSRCRLATTVSRGRSEAESQSR
jgi:hypothetical protein